MNANKNRAEMSDLELLSLYCEKCSGFIDPLIFRQLERRGLMKFVNGLKGSPEEMKAGMYARLAEAGRVFGEPEIDAIAGKIDRLKSLRRQFNQLTVTESAQIEQVLEAMSQVNREILNYFKPK